MSAGHKKTSYDQVHIKLVRGDIVCAEVRHKIWAGYPGQTWELVHAREDVKRKAGIDFIGKKRAEMNPYASWFCKRRGLDNKETEVDTYQYYFIHVCQNQENTMPSRRKEWGSLLAQLLAAAFKFNPPRTYAFEADHIPNDPTQLRYLSDLLTTTDTLSVAQLCYSQNKLRDILCDDEALGVFFPHSRFRDVRDYYSGQLNPKDAEVEHSIKTTQFEH